MLFEGTGKSFVGALCAKILLQSGRSSIVIPRYGGLRLSPSTLPSNTKILVNCYTNHALDQFLEDLINIGIPKDEIVRIGGKPNQATAELSLQSLGKSEGYRMSRADWNEVEERRKERNRLTKSLHHAYSAATARHQQIMQYVAVHHSEYATAFRVPKSTDGTIIVGKGGKAIGPNYLLNRWLRGEDAGPFKNNSQIRLSRNIWEMDRSARLSQSETWRREVVKKGIEDMLRIGKCYNWCITALESIYRRGEASVLRKRTIIGCTTTGAAMYKSVNQVGLFLTILTFE